MLRVLVPSALIATVQLWAGASQARDEVDPRPRSAVSPATAPVAPRAPDIPQPSLVWRWEPFQTWEYVATAGFAAASVLPLLVPVDRGRWTSDNELDSGVRSALRPASRSARRTAGDASDVAVAVGINHLLFDSMVVAWSVHGRGSVAWQMTLIDVETLALTRALTSITKAIASRERPYAEECAGGTVLKDLDECRGSDRYRSFFSGHTSTAFAVAGLSCMHHAHLPLYGSAVADGLACVGSLATAGAVGVLRIVADDHHPSDVFTGAAVGTAVGLGLPWLLHYRHRRPELDAGAPRRAPAISVRFVPGPTSGAVVGEF